MTRARCAAALPALAVVALAAAPTGSPHSAAAPTPPSSTAALEQGPDLPFQPLLAAVSCQPSQVKYGSDADRDKVNQTVTPTTVTWLRGQPIPTSYPSNKRNVAVELNTYQLAVTLTQYKLENDGDYHLVVVDGAGRSMIVEIPFDACVPSTSLWKSRIAAARQTVDATYHVTGQWTHVSRPITVTGLGFMDRIHAVTGQAPNGVELHPVIGITFN